MALDTPAVTHRSNSDMTMIEIVMSNTSLPSAVRMAWIAARSAEWDRQTAGTVGRHIAETELARREAAGTVYP